MKDTAVKQEIEKNEELVRSSIRAVVALSRLPEVGEWPSFFLFGKKTKKNNFFSHHNTIFFQMETRDSPLFLRRSGPRSITPSWNQSWQRLKRGMGLTRWTPLKQETEKERKKERERAHNRRTRKTKEIKFDMFLKSKSLKNDDLL
jgi:hypothetical protein